MFTITDDTARNALIVAPSGRIEKGDFDALTKRFDRRVSETGTVPNLVIHTPDFPGWADFGALVRHLQFVKGHQKLIEKVALVSDSRVLDLAPRIADHFVQAELRHFPADALDAALDWVAEPVETDRGVTVMTGLPDGVVGLSVTGTVTARDYARTIVPLIEDHLTRHDRIGLLYHIGPEFDSYTAGAAWSDLRLGVMHLTSFRRIALVTDIGWITRGTRLFAPLIPAELQVFPESGLDEARAWLANPPAA